MEIEDYKLEYLRDVYGMTELEAEAYHLCGPQTALEEIAGTMGIRVDEVDRLISSAERKLMDNLDQSHKDGYIWLD